MINSSPNTLATNLPSSVDSMLHPQLQAIRSTLAWPIIGRFSYFLNVLTGEQWYKLRVNSQSKSAIKL